MYLITVLNWRGELKLKKYFVKEIEGPISLWVHGIWLTMKTKRVATSSMWDCNWHVGARNRLQRRNVKEYNMTLVAANSQLDYPKGGFKRKFNFTSCFDSCLNK